MKPLSALGSSLTRRIRYSNIFAKVPMAPPDPILGINVAYANDTDNRKVNLGVGAYRDDNLKPVVFSVVRKVEEQLVADRTLNMVANSLLRNTSPSTESRASSPAAKSSFSAKTPPCSRKAEWPQPKPFQALVP
jgi:hypothetical protein